MFSVKGDDVLGLKKLSPLYWAVIECEPTESDEVVKTTCPEVMGPIPMSAVPSMKVTVPEGFSAPCDGVPTIAISVIGFPDSY